MAVILGTLGFRAGSMLPTLESTPAVDQAVIFCNDHPRTMGAFNEVLSICDLMGIEVKRVSIPDAFDLLQAAKTIKEEVRRLKGAGIEISVFNIAGGTKVMSAAAFMICAIEGLKSVYVHDETNKEILLPLLKVDYSQLLTPSQKELCRFLWGRRDRPMTQVEIAQGMGKHKATVNHHIQMMEEKGIVRLVCDKSDRRKKVVVVDDALDLILESSDD